MSDQNFHEIQLSGKQLLFGFMSAVVLLVVIFLLGVSVGRGVRTNAPERAGDVAAAPGAPGDTTVPTEPPAAAAANPTPADLNYQAVLKGQTPPATTAEPPASEKAAPPATPPPASEQTQPKGEGVKPPAPPPSQAQTPAPRTSAASGASPQTPPPTAKPPSPGVGWVAQVGAYKTERAAQSVVSDLKRRGFAAAYVMPFGEMFRVRVGPFASKAEADQEQKRLSKAGFPSSVIR